MSRLIVLLPPHQSWTPWTGLPPPDDEDREYPYRLLAQRGFAYVRIDLSPFPVNPAAKLRPFFRAIDPFRALTVLLLKREAEVVVCFFESSALVVLALRRLFRFKGKVVVVDLGDPAWRLRRLVLDFVVPRADAILPFSSSQVAAIRETWPRARVIRQIHAQVDTKFYAEAKDHSNGPVLAIGDDFSRDYATFLAACRNLGHPVTIRSKVLSFFPERLPPTIKVISEPLPLPVYRDLITSASIMVLPMHPVINGGGTSALVQSMASGKATVVSASPGILDYVEDGKTALVVPCHDPEAMRAAIIRLLTDHMLRCRMGAAARQRAVRFNSYLAFADTIESVVNEVAVKQF